MATIGEISQGASYRGDPVLGGANAPALKFDVNPFEKLAAYTQFYNKNMWEQKIKDRDAKIGEVADAANIDLYSLRGKDRDELIKAVEAFKPIATAYTKKSDRTFNR